MSIQSPEDLKEFPWLSMLMEAYAVSDQAVKEVQDKDFDEHGFKAACSKGCIPCCYQQFIPLTTLELAGIVWYICNKMDPQAQQSIMEVLEGYSGDRTCPMLQGPTCAVYPVRPLACRQFVVYEKACESREDVLGTRPEQVLKLDESSIRQVFRAMLPFYEIHTPDAQEVALHDKYWLKQSSYMHQVDWPSLFIK
ncbi:YkgJ family cysteine cluster protein [Pseudodesulfovibrio sp.]|nr:YkgJ family cysteine cluster protein [Pseudodesulfovibrio sp.]